MFSLVFLAALASPIAYGATYDCGPNYVRFVVNSCAGATCDVTYQNPGQRAYRTRWNVSQVQLAIGRGCHPSVAPVRPAVARPATGGGPIVLGKYECYTSSGGELEAAMALNFTLYGGGRFTDYAGHPGTWSYAGGYVTLRGTGLNGQRLRYTPGVVHGDNPPHLTFSQGDSCDGVG